MEDEIKKQISLPQNQIPLSDIIKMKEETEIDEDELMERQHLDERDEDIRQERDQLEDLQERGFNY